MADACAEDLLSLDRDVARVAGLLARWRTDLALDAARNPGVPSDLEDPFEVGRHVASKSTWDALLRLSVGPAEAMHRDALRRWVVSLMQARIGLVFEVAMARAREEPRGRLGGSAPRLVSFSEAWRGVLGAETVGEAGEWLRAAADCAPAYADLARRRAVRREVVAQRLGLDHPWSPLVAVTPAAMGAVASEVLDATEDLWRYLIAETSGPGAAAVAVFRTAVARDRGEGWPSQVSLRWLTEVTGMAANGVEIEVPSLPAGLGAASFLRALYAAGFAARVALSRSGLPFSLAQDPLCVAGHRWALAFSSLGIDIGWQRRQLELGSRVAAEHVRRLAHSALFELRVLAARILLGRAVATATDSLFEELCVRLFGLPLDIRLRGAWPSLRDDDPARLLAWLQAPPFIGELREGFDDDWYRNPRAWSRLRELAARPAHEAVDPARLDGQARGLARAFEVALG
jgi:hypothetical protein